MDSHSYQDKLLEGNHSLFTSWNICILVTIFIISIWASTSFFLISKEMRSNLQKIKNSFQQHSAVKIISQKWIILLHLYKNSNVFFTFVYIWGLTPLNQMEKSIAGASQKARTMFMCLASLVATKYSFQSTSLYLVWQTMQKDLLNFIWFWSIMHWDVGV